VAERRVRADEPRGHRPHRLEGGARGRAGSDARAALLAERTAALEELGAAIPVARLLEVDAVIDPADTRRWLTAALTPW
jgi:acetyl-CoA carboxylase carboxyltransferase component